MAFKTNQRIEQIYFDNIRKELDVLKKWKDGETDLKTSDVLQAVIDADSAIIMLYKNLGEAYAETVAMIEVEKAALLALRSEYETFKASTEETLQYLSGKVSEIDERLATVEDFMEETSGTRIFLLEPIGESGLDFKILDFKHPTSGVEFTFTDLNNIFSVEKMNIILRCTGRNGLVLHLSNAAYNELMFSATVKEGNEYALYVYTLNSTTPAVVSGVRKVLA